MSNSIGGEPGHTGSGARDIRDRDQSGVCRNSPIEDFLPREILRKALSIAAPPLNSGANLITEKSNAGFQAIDVEARVFEGGRGGAPHKV